MKTRLLLHHVSKDRNLETLHNLSSNFFNLDEIVLIGRRKAEKNEAKNNSNSNDSKTNANGNDDDSEEEKDFTTNSNNTNTNATSTSSSSTQVKAYKYFREAIDDLQLNNNDNLEEEKEKEKKSVSIISSSKKRHILVGIEIEPDAVPANQLRQTITSKFPECESVSFIMGSEGEGMSDLEKSCCDVFVYVQQFFRVVQQRTDEDENGGGSGGGGAGSLNVATAVAVTLSQFFDPSPPPSLTTTSSSLTSSSSSLLQIVPVLPFSVEVEKSRRVHFLVRPCTAFGANFVSIVCSTHKVFMGDRGNRSSFGKNMSAEVHCPIESYSTSFQALRDIREKTALMVEGYVKEENRLKRKDNDDNKNDQQQESSSSSSVSRQMIVVGVELSYSSSSSNNNNNEEPSFTRQLEQSLSPLLAVSRNSASASPFTIALLFASPPSDENDENHHGKLSESDRKQCDVVLKLRSRSSDNNRNNNNKNNSINLPCFISIVLHRLSLFFGFAEGSKQDDENVSKFVVSLKQKYDSTKIHQVHHQDQQQQQQQQQKKICPLLTTASDDNNASNNGDDDGDSLFGALMMGS